MSSPMAKIFTAILIFLTASTSLATIVEPQETFPNSKTLVSLGINIEFYSGPVCGTASDIYISVPKKYEGAKFSGATLTLAENGELLLFTNLPAIESAESMHSNKPVHGTTFCVHASKYHSATVSLLYSKGQHTTNVITLNNIGTFVK